MTNQTALLPPMNPLQLDVARFYAECVAWLTSHWPFLLIALVLALLTYGAIRGARRLGMRLCERDRPGTLGWWKIAGRTLARTGRFFATMAGLELGRHVADPPAAIGALIHALFTIAATLQVAFWTRELILGTVEHKSSGDTMRGETLASALGIVRVVVSFAVFAIAFVVVLDNLGVNVTGLVAGLGIGGIAIGLAAQGIFGDLFAALAIIFDRPFRRGDVISYDKTTGTVEEIGLKSTRLRAATGETRIIANRQLLDKEIQNVSLRDYRRATFTLTLAQWTPAETLARLPDMLREEVERLGLKFVQAGFIGFGASSFDVQLDFDSPSPDWSAFYTARHQAGLAIIARLAAERIDLAYPTQTTFTAAPEGGYVMPYPIKTD